MLHLYESLCSKLQCMGLLLSFQCQQKHAHSNTIRLVLLSICGSNKGTLHDWSLFQNKKQVRSCDQFYFEAGPLYHILALSTWILSLVQREEETAFYFSPSCHLHCILRGYFSFLHLIWFYPFFEDITEELIQI